ncbi:hypothetical protein Q3C12_12710 [Paenibacillus ehimensis]|uniref:Uncharacterized protein n=1 Tax=Paenibacillus ehimensis TaxID=79264 RepID=A0ABT8VA74_9BACL|nr:hypothetical protein [Paenibacillus ehimensis]MDO3677866.1 hypothetical protein [Paenibacillus ehimensis]
MLKKRYYVSVGTGTIEDAQTLADLGDYSYEYAVEATDQEIRELRWLMSSYEAETEKTFARAGVPYKSADHDEATDEYNAQVRELYAMIYRLGTPETRGHIEKMRIMEKLGNPDYRQPGYGKHNAEEAIEVDKRERVEPK